MKKGSWDPFKNFLSMDLALFLHYLYSVLILMFSQVNYVDKFNLFIY